MTPGVEETNIPTHGPMMEHWAEEMGNGVWAQSPPQ